MNEDDSVIYRVDLDAGEFEALAAVSAAELMVKEKRIEQWVAAQPELLFSEKDAVMVIAQELSGEPLADLLAVDSQGTLIVVEIKRHGSDRSTVGQLLDYAAGLSEWKYEAFNHRWKAYKPDGGELIEAFREFLGIQEFPEADFLARRRYVILACDADASLKRIVGWLRDKYQVPVDFAPFTLLRRGDDVFLQITKIDVEPLLYQPTWAGDWFFNTDETHLPGAWEKMREHNVIADFGYGHAKSKHKMDLPRQGDRVFAYMNGYGILGVGRVEEEESYAASTVFQQSEGDEFHRKVSWSATVPREQAVRAQEVSQWGYNLPVRCTIGGMSNSKVADIIARELERRASAPKTQ